VDQILFVENVMVLVLVLVYLNTLVIHMLVVNPNAFPTMIVLETKRVYSKNVKILVQEFVESMRSVKL
jgi:hypothetical protein